MVSFDDPNGSRDKSTKRTYQRLRRRIRSSSLRQGDPARREPDALMFGVTASVERSAGGSGAGRRGLGLRLRLNKSYLPASCSKVNGDLPDSVFADEAE